MATFLLVDDSMFMRQTLKNIIQADGHQVIGEAADGSEAIQMYRKQRPDIVIMDITMPVMDGIQALQEIKKIDEASKIIMCSAMGQQRFIIEAIQFGAKEFIVKPFLKEKILKSIQNVLQM